MVCCLCKECVWQIRVCCKLKTVCFANKGVLQVKKGVLQVKKGDFFQKQHFRACPNMPGHARTCSGMPEHVRACPKKCKFLLTKQKIQVFARQRARTLLRGSVSARLSQCAAQRARARTARLNFSQIFAKCQTPRTYSTARLNARAGTARFNFYSDFFAKCQTPRTYSTARLSARLNARARTARLNFFLRFLLSARHRARTLLRGSMRGSVRAHVLRGSMRARI